MPNIIIQGSLIEVLSKMRRIKQVITYRVSVGYTRFQHDEEWQYLTAQDERVCKPSPTLPWTACGPLHGDIYRGDYLVDDFKFYVSDGTKKIRVNNHLPFKDNCRCEAKWVNVHEVLVERLYREMENA